MIEVDNKRKLAFTRHDPIGVCGQMYVGTLCLCLTPIDTAQHPLELSNQYVVSPFAHRTRVS